MKALRAVDPEVHAAIVGEIRRQSSRLELIASENHTPRAVLEAAGSVMTNKYAEGYPGKRYYGGCQYMDVVEDLARERARALFGADHANVQPHSGAQANMAAYFAFLKPGDTLLGMNLSHGGHLTHGSPVNFSGMLYSVVPYGVSRETETIDYEEMRLLARRHSPKMIVAGASAYSRIIDFPTLRSIADEAGALLLVDMAHFAGLVAGGVHPSPVPHADIVTSTTHKTLRGPRGGFILSRADHARAIDKMTFPGVQGGPLMHIIAAKAVAFKLAMTEEFRAYARQVVVNARALAAGLAQRGYDIVSGGTDTHLFLVNLTRRGLTGKEAEEALEANGIIVNKNTIPFETRSPFITSGIRVGTPAVTTRGMGVPEMREIADLIDRTLVSRGAPTAARHVQSRVEELCRRYPLYADLLEEAGEPARPD